LHASARRSFAHEEYESVPVKIGAWFKSVMAPNYGPAAAS
jgi:hypothetical protein